MAREGEEGKPGFPPVGATGGSGGSGGRGGEGEPGGIGKTGKTGEKGDPGAYEAIHRWRWRGLVVWIIVFTCVAFYNSYTNRVRSEEGLEAKAALCVIKHDLERRVETTEKFLDDNPGPVVLGNVPRGVLQTSVKDQRNTVTLIENEISCPPRTGIIK